ncbi:Elicitor-responsive protein 1, partial [Linum perenne]
TPYYYVIIECANQHRISKLSIGEHHKTSWNQKFRFELPLIDWKRMTHLKLTIMDTEHLKNGDCIGETIIYLGGIVAEGKNRGIVEMKPSPYNVVLEDGTFKGQVKIGIKFTISNSTSTSDAAASQKRSASAAVWEAIAKMWRSSWWKFWSYCSPKSKQQAKSN